MGARRNATGIDGRMKWIALDLDLQLAEKVYRSLLPKRLTISGIDVVTRLQSFNRIGGDYATVFETSDRRVYICVSDSQRIESPQL